MQLNDTCTFKGKNAKVIGMYIHNGIVKRYMLMSQGKHKDLYHWVSAKNSSLPRTAR